MVAVALARERGTELGDKRSEHADGVDVGSCTRVVNVIEDVIEEGAG